MSRPAKSKEDRLSAILKIRMTESEHDKLKRLAAQCGYTVAEIARRKVLDEQLVVRTSRRLPVDAYNELKKIGVNLNQMARRMNASPRVDPLDVQLVRHDIDRLMDLLGDHHEPGAR